MGENIKFLKDWRLHITILICCMISDRIGTITIPITSIIKVSLLPLLYAMVLVTILYLLKPVKWIGEAQSKSGGFMLTMTCLILGAKLGCNVGPTIQDMFSASLPLLTQNVGDAFTCVMALPLALLLGMKRETIGLTYAASRESGIAVIEQKYGRGAEFRGVIAMYVVGTIFGTVLIGLFASILSTTGIFHVYSVAMACGVGSAAMSTAGIGTLIEIYPAMADKITAFASMSNLISTAIAIYLNVFIGLPLAEFLYKKLYPVIGRGRKEKIQAEKGE
ncbi:MAG: DUF3100 domain-containing protein [Clostridiales bacterium]|nr:DUF3100 domain-containing protein [Clostridiales bacterium]